MAITVCRDKQKQAKHTLGDRMQHSQHHNLKNQQDKTQNQKTPEQIHLPWVRNLEECKSIPC